MTSSSSAILPDVGLDSWVRLLYVGRGCILMHCGVSLARSARYQYSHKVTCHFLVIPIVSTLIELNKRFNLESSFGGQTAEQADVVFLTQSKIVKEKYICTSSQCNGGAIPENTSDFASDRISESFGKPN